MIESCFVVGVASGVLHPGWELLFGEARLGSDVMLSGRTSSVCDMGHVQ
jgi:hypothetical protein